MTHLGRLPPCQRSYCLCGVSTAFLVTPPPRISSAVLVFCLTHSSLVAFELAPRYTCVSLDLFVLPHIFDPACLLSPDPPFGQRSTPSAPVMAINPLTATAAELQAKLTDNSTTSQRLVKIYLDQIARHNGYLKAVIATAPESLLEKAAAELDNERACGIVRGPLHGIPFLAKVLVHVLIFCTEYQILRN